MPMNHSIKALLLAGCAALITTGMAACSGDDTTVAPKDGGTDTGTKDGGGTDAPVGVDSGGGTDAGTDTGVTPLPTGRIDRMGRPAINTALNFHDDPTKDKYNQ